MPLQQLTIWSGTTRHLSVGFVLMLCWSCLAHGNCDGTNPVPGLTSFYSNGWGIDPANRRFQPAGRTSISAANVSRLKLKWSYGFSNMNPRSYPLVTEDTLFIGDTGVGLVALDRSTGCTRWTLRHSGRIASAILYRRSGGKVTLYFADQSQGIYAVDAANGKLMWQTTVKGQPLPLYSGTPLVYGNDIFVPLSSAEVGLAANPFYGCCTTSGAMVALDAATGTQRWYQPTIRQKPTVTGRHFLFVEEHAPSGAPVWGTPTLDVGRGLLLFGTGQNYSRPTTTTSDAIFALDASDGTVRWVRQFTTDDAYNVACDLSVKHPNCPKPRGPDLDFGAPPMVAQLADGRELVIVGEKSGGVYALEPATGTTVWQQQVGRGGALGGVHWGMAFNQQLGLVFAPVSDISGFPTDLPAKPGLFALDAATGAIRWFHERKPRCPQRSCSPGISAAIIATPDLVFAGSLDGYLEAYDAASGALLWSEDSWQDFKTVNGVSASGGSFDAHGPMVAGDQLMVSSGYGQFFQRGGNALLVYQLEPEP